MTEQTTTTAQRFTLDETAAREWLREMTETHEAWMTGDGPVAELEISTDWQPLSFGNETDIYTLVRVAADAGIIGCPEGFDVDFEYADDDDGGWYRFLVTAGPRLTLASYAYEMRKLDGHDAKGAEAALAILSEAVDTANAQLAHLDEYVTSRTASPVAS